MHTPVVRFMHTPVVRLMLNFPLVLYDKFSALS